MNATFQHYQLYQRAFLLLALALSKPHIQGIEFDMISYFSLRSQTNALIPRFPRRACRHSACLLAIFSKHSVPIACCYSQTGCKATAAGVEPTIYTV